MNISGRKKCEVEGEEDLLQLQKLLEKMSALFDSNLAILEMSVELSKKCKVLSFQYIKHIYKTLTEAKANEIIFRNDEPEFARFAFAQNGLERMCWRLIEKIILKVSYFLIHERPLLSISPFVLKLIKINRNAMTKTINLKGSFKELIFQAIHILLEENSVLEEQIYQILVEKGFVCSKDQFYRLNGFEAQSQDLSCTPTDIHLQSYRTAHPTHAESGAHHRIGRPRRQPSNVFDCLKEASFLKRERLQERQSEVDCIREQDGMERAEREDAEEGEGRDKGDVSLEKANKVRHEIHEQLQRSLAEMQLHSTFTDRLEEVLSEQKKETPNSFISISRNSNKSLLKQLVKNLANEDFQSNEQVIYLSHKEPLFFKMPAAKPTSKGSKPKQMMLGTINKRLQEVIMKTEHLKNQNWPKIPKENQFSHSNLNAANQNPLQLNKATVKKQQLALRKSIAQPLHVASKKQKSPKFSLSTTADRMLRESLIKRVQTESQSAAMGDIRMGDIRMGDNRRKNVDQYLLKRVQTESQSAAMGEIDSFLDEKRVRFERKKKKGRRYLGQIGNQTFEVYDRWQGRVFG